MTHHVNNTVRFAVVAALALLLMAGAAVAPVQAGGEATAPQQGAAAQSIDIQGFAFNPGTIRVAVGTKVTWTNSDSAPHTVTGDKGEFDSGRLAPGATFDHTFDTVGTFAYHCQIHSSMKGVIEVVEAGAVELTQPMQPQAKAPVAKAPAAKKTAKNNSVYGSGYSYGNAGMQGYGMYGPYGNYGYGMYPGYNMPYNRSPFYAPYRIVRPRYFFPYRPFRPIFRPCRCW